MPPAQSPTGAVPNTCFPPSVPKDNPILKQLLPEHQQKVLRQLSPDLPLAVTANLIDDEDYWHRCCEQRWPVCHLDCHGGSWKHLFFERHLENLIKHFIPETTDPAVILDLLPLCRNYVRRIRVDQFLPPVQLPPPPRSGDQSDSGSEGEVEEPSMDHYQLGELVAGLTQLEELDLVYGIKDCGMNFEWNLFLFTYRDCHSLAATIKACHTLKVPSAPRPSPVSFLSISLTPSHLLCLSYPHLPRILFLFTDRVSFHVLCTQLGSGDAEMREALPSQFNSYLFLRQTSGPRALS